MIKNILFWIIAIVITLASAYYQRATGPTHPYKGKVEISDIEVKYSLIRSFPRPTDAPVSVNIADTTITGCFKYKRHPSNDEWTFEKMVRKDDNLIAFIPQQAPAGKVMYKIFLENNGQQFELSEKPLIIRFRGDVPAWAMIPHIILMFAAMLFSMRAGIAAITKNKTYTLAMLTLIFLIVGGLIFGPIVQKFAFGDYWTGWPNGTDLTDNKTAFAFLFWVFAFIKTYKNHNHKTWVIVASIVLLLVYLIPHSMFGSEIDFRE
jgi:hypothetical protein